jgi:hypothetical protein
MKTKHFHISQNTGEGINLMNNDNQRKDIYNVKGMAESARYTEYKFIESAAAEIVDNSIEAQAAKISIIISEKNNPNTGRKEISDIAFLDDGNGMDLVELHGCLSFGEGTRKAREGIGRFGVGLAQASLFACPRVEVYSWKALNEYYYTFLDTDMMKSGEQEYIEQPKKKSIPDKYIGLNRQSSHGTLVVWKNVDKSPVKTAQTLIRRLDEYLGRTYRYFLNDQVVKIVLMSRDNVANYTSVKPRDPLFIMPNDKNLADPNNLGRLTDNHKNGETIFEPFIPTGYGSHVIEKEIKYRNNYDYELTGIVKIVFSIVKEKYYALPKELYNNPGDSDIGQAIRDFTGISIVRARREVDFGKFGFFDSTNSPYHRWWGCEIQFEPLLDEKFKISNNKQHIELKKPKNSEIREMEITGDVPLWSELEDVVSAVIKEMVKINKERRKGTRPSPAPPPSAPPPMPKDEGDHQGDTNPKPPDAPNPIEDLLNSSNLAENPVVSPDNGKEEYRLISIIEQASLRHPHYLKIIDDPTSQQLIDIKLTQSNLLIEINKNALCSDETTTKINGEDLAIILLKSICDSFYSDSVSPESYTLIDAITRLVNNRFKDYMKNGGSQ